MRLGHDMGAPANACRARRWVTGSPSAGTTRRRDEGIPGYWAVLFVRAACQTPRRVRHPLALTMVTLLPSGYSTLWAPGILSISGPHAAAHTLAYLRIAGVVILRRRKARYRLAG